MHGFGEKPAQFIVEAVADGAHCAASGVDCDGQAGPVMFAQQAAQALPVFVGGVGMIEHQPYRVEGIGLRIVETGLPRYSPVAPH